MSSSSSSSSSENLSPEAVARGLSILVEHTKKDLAKLKTSKSSSSSSSSISGGEDSRCEPPSLSHYRVLPDNLKTAYGLLLQGSQLVRATATKYALVGAIDTKDQGSLGTDLLKGCELVGAASHFTMVDGHGCSGPVRVHTHRACLSICLACWRLVQAFHPEAAATVARERGSTAEIGGDVARKDNNVGAQKTGAVWEACDHVINKMLPQGNRNAMRREIFRWTRDCNDTMEEFTEMIDLGPKEEDDHDDEGEDDDDDDGGYLGGFGGDDQYSNDELPAAKACLSVLKNSRGNLKVALETCEALGKLANESSSSGNTDDDTDAKNRAACLEGIHTVYLSAKKIGDGVTDLGSLMYPPLIPASDDLKAGVDQQVRCILELQSYILTDLKETQNLDLPASVTELSNTLQTAGKTRHREFLESVRDSSSSTNNNNGTR